jgi:hypothetical protein
MFRKDETAPRQRPEHGKGLLPQPVFSTPTPVVNIYEVALLRARLSIGNLNAGEDWSGSVISSIGYADERPENVGQACGMGEWVDKRRAVFQCC